MRLPSRSDTNPTFRSLSTGPLRGPSFFFIRLGHFVLARNDISGRFRFCCSATLTFGDIRRCNQDSWQDGADVRRSEGRVSFETQAPNLATFHPKEKQPCRCLDAAHGETESPGRTTQRKHGPRTEVHTTAAEVARGIDGRNEKETARTDTIQGTRRIVAAARSRRWKQSLRGMRRRGDKVNSQLCE